MRLFCECILLAVRDGDDDIWPGIIWIFCDLNAFANLLSDLMMILLSANGTKLMLLFVMVCCDRIFIFGGIRWVVVIVVVVVGATVDDDDVTRLFLCDTNCDVDCDGPFDCLELSSIIFEVATGVGVDFIDFGADACCW